jgi:SpoVK/Ycf46/Vps4 family AAA+-type ATPase
MKVLFYQDFSLKKELLADCNVCRLSKSSEPGFYEFLKIITPFTRERTYDFLVAKANELEGILRELNIRQEKANFTSVHIPIIGNYHKVLMKESIEFLLNEKFREFCIEHRIPLKRGIILEGMPGTGKTLSLRWLKEQALKNKIEFISFKSPREFIEDKERYYQSGKKIFVFEDFDAMLLDRKKTENTPNNVLMLLLNTLEGIDEIKDVVSIFTTNHIEGFDSAFVRPGRIDKVIRYTLPTEGERMEFLDEYLPEFTAEQKKFVLDHLKNHEYLRGEAKENDVGLSFAMLKGICDDINIFKFNNQLDLTNGSFQSTLKKIMDDKLSGASKWAKPHTAVGFGEEDDDILSGQNDL